MIQYAVYNLSLGYLKDSNAAAHSVDTGITQAVGIKIIENDIECPIYMLESTRIITISLQKELVGTLFGKSSSGYQLWFCHSKLFEMIEIQIVYPYISLETRYFSCCLLHFIK